MSEARGLIVLTGGGRAIRQADLVRLVDEPDLAPLPADLGAWVGMANDRGEVIAVADLGILSGDGAIASPVLAVLRSDEQIFGLLIEGAEDSATGPGPGALTDEPHPDDPVWLLPAPPGEPRVIDPSLLLESAGGDGAG